MTGWLSQSVVFPGCSFASLKDSCMTTNLIMSFDFFLIIYVDTRHNSMHEMLAEVTANLREKVYHSSSGL